MTNNMPQIRLIDGKPVTTSRQLAEYFHKRHDHVLAKISTLDCSDQFLTSNFSGVKYNHRGNEYTEYNITRDGFAFLAMGFTGKKAAVFKEAYIDAFNKMEARLNKQQDFFKSLPNLTQRDERLFKESISYFFGMLRHLKSPFERSALVAYLHNSAKEYSIAQSVEVKLGIKLDTVVGLLTDDRSTLIFEGSSYKVVDVKREGYKWMNGFIRRDRLIDYIPE